MDIREGFSRKPEDSPADIELNQELTEDVIDAAWLVNMPGPVCAYWSEEDAPMCRHVSCYAIMQDCDGEPEHDCPKERFLDDPITRAYGVGSEMVHLIPCHVCDERDACEYEWPDNPAPRSSWGRQI